jgi:hypothetical protein
MAEEDIPEELGVPEQQAGSKDQQPSGPSLTDRIQDAQNQYQNLQDAKDLFKKGKAKLAAKKGAKEAGQKGLKEGVEKQGANAAKRKVATQGAQQAGKVAAKAGAKAAGTALGEAAVGTGAAVAGAEVGATAGSVVPVVGTIIGAIVGAALPWLVSKVKKYWKVPVYVIAGILCLAAIPFALLGLKTTTLTPTTAAQQQQANTAAYISGDFISNGKVTKSSVDQEKARYKRVIDHLSPDKVAVTQTAINGIEELMDQAINTSGQARANLIKQINEQVRALDATLPYGEWVAQEAEKYVGPNKIPSNFCRITGNNDPNMGCASVVSVILYDAGVPQPLTKSQQVIWHNSRLAQIVAPAPNHQKDWTLYSQNKDRLKRGDVVWWGNGVRTDPDTGLPIVIGLQSHVGIYIGNNKAINNSSTLAEKAGEAVPRITDLDRKDLPFNGAKRYGVAP